MNIIKYIKELDKYVKIVELGIGAALTIAGVLWITPLRDIVIIMLPPDMDKDRLLVSGIGVVLGVIILIAQRNGVCSAKLTNDIAELQTKLQTMTVELTATNNTMKEAEEKTNGLTNTIAKMRNDITQNRLHHGTMKIYEDVNIEIRKRQANGDKIEITILAFTLFSICNKFADWKRKGELFNITFNLCHLDSNFIKSSNHIDQSWADALEGNLAIINNFISQNREYLRKNNVTVNFFPYSHIPVVHGFRLSNGAYYISLAFWDDTNKILPPDEIEYEIIMENDLSQRANHLRRVFNNWTEAAFRQP